MKLMSKSVRPIAEPVKVISDKSCIMLATKKYKDVIGIYKDGGHTLIYYKNIQYLFAPVSTICTFKAQNPLFNLRGAYRLPLYVYL